MIRRTRAAVFATLSALALAGVAAPAASANPLSIVPLVSCANEQPSQPFAPWGDYNNYTPVAGGNFETGSFPWTLTGGAKVVSGNETYHVGGARDSHSLALPAGSSATSPYMCTSIYHPMVRLFVRNTGSPASHLIVQAVYPTLVGVATSQVGYITGSSTWQPSSSMGLLWGNLMATLSLNQTSIAFRFVPADNTGNWRIDDVYLDPYARG